jgi:hypothetical protein
MTVLAGGQVRVVSSFSGTDVLSSVERVEFADRGYAFDNTGGAAAKLITAAFGKSQVAKYLSAGLQYLDSGWSLQALSDLVSASGLVDRAVGSSSPQAFIKHVFQNTVLRQPTSTELNFFESMLTSGTYSKAGLLALAAGVVSDTSAGLVASDGITVTGVAYDLG